MWGALLLRAMPQGRRCGASRGVRCSGLGRDSLDHGAHPEALPEPGLPMMQAGFRYAPGVAPRDYGLRWYQTEAKAAAEQELRDHRSTLIVMPTGTGKTTVFGAIAADWEE